MKSNVGRCPYFSSPSFTRSWVADLIQGTGFPGSSRSNLLEVAQTAIGGNLIGETHTVDMPSVFLGFKLLELCSLLHDRAGGDE